MMASSPQYTHAILDLCKVHTLETTTMVDYQFAYVLSALLGLMITLHINLVLLHRFTDEQRFLLCPVLLLHLSVRNLKLARNGSFGSEPVEPADGGILFRVALLSMRYERESLACPEHHLYVLN